MFRQLQDGVPDGRNFGTQHFFRKGIIQFMFLVLFVPRSEQNGAVVRLLIGPVFYGIDQQVDGCFQPVGFYQIPYFLDRKSVV